MKEDLIIDYFNKCREISFPFPHFPKKDIIEDFDNLNKTTSKKSNVGLKTIYNFHPSLWMANKENKKSPFQGWEDDALLIKVIENRLKYKGENLSIKNILDGFSIADLAPKVSLFKPALAKYLISKYLNAYDTIFDPCSGYSGRLLGAVSLNKKYIGQDINPVTTEESSNLISELNIKDCEIKNVNSLGFTGTYGCLFTCPPYGSKENWNQSIEDLSCDEWIDICLNNYHCESYLFVIDGTKKYKNYEVESLVNKSHFNTNTEKIILIKR